MCGVGEFSPIFNPNKQEVNMYCSLNSRSIIFLLLSKFLLLSQIAVAQDSGQLAGQGNGSELNTAEQSHLLQTVRESISSKSSANGIKNIPDHELYMMIFAEILISPGSAYGFTSADWEIIANLPSHQDVRFRAVTDKEMRKFCTFVETEKRETVSAALEVADQYEKAKNATDQLLSQHYETIIASLSEQGRATLKQRIETVNDRMELVHTNIDVRNIAQSAPAYTIRMLKSGCMAITAERNAQGQDAAQLPGTLLLSEELIQNANINSVTTENSSTFDDQ